MAPSHTKLTPLTTYSATVAIGAWVTITAVAFDPFVQQLLSFRTDLVFEDSAVVRVATAQHWSGGGEVLSRPFSGES